MEATIFLQSIMNSAIEIPITEIIKILIQSCFDLFLPSSFLDSGAHCRPLLCFLISTLVLK